MLAPGGGELPAPEERELLPATEPPSADEESEERLSLPDSALAPATTGVHSESISEPTAGGLLARCGGPRARPFGGSRATQRFAAGGPAGRRKPWLAPVA
jgi:hypothetical protein